MRQPGRFANLPIEILDLILDRLRGLYELVHLALVAITCKTLLRVAQKRLQNAHQKHYGPSWSGCRLICLGSSTFDDELPVGFLTPEEKREAATTIVEGEEEPSERYYQSAGFSDSFSESS